jgi:hypothetical protein
MLFLRRATQGCFVHFTCRAQHSYMVAVLANAACQVTSSLQSLLQGRPVQSVQWGAWAEAGMAAGQSGLLSRLARQGYGALAPAAGLAVLRSALQGVQGVAAEAVRSSGSVVMAAVFRWDRFLSGECRGYSVSHCRTCSHPRADESRQSRIMASRWP